MKNQQLLLFNQETERLRFRMLTEADFNEWLKFCTDPQSLQYIPLGGSEHPEEKCRMWFDRVFNRYENGLGGMNVLVDKTTGLLVGQCGLLIQQVDTISELEIGYSLMPEHRGKGYAYEAAIKCRDYAFENNLANSLISIIHPENKYSANVALKNGMIAEKSTIHNNSPATIFRITQTEWMNNAIRQ